MDYDCSNHPTINAFMDSDAFIRGLMGPFGSGKSSACVIEIGQRGLAIKPGVDGLRRSKWAVVRNTTKQLEDTTERTFLQWFPPYQYGDWTPSKHRYVIKALKNPGDDRHAEIEVLFRALDRPDQMGDLLSLDITGGWVNEAREVDWQIIEAMIGRLGRYPPVNMGGASWSGLIMDTNPPDAESPWYNFFEEADHTEQVAELARFIPGITVDQFCKVFKQPSGLSPMAENLEWLPLGYYQKLMIGKSEEWVTVHVKGQYGFVMDGKPVWPEYQDSIHCPDDRNKWPRAVQGLPILRSWDFGLTPAVVFSQLNTRGQWNILDELVATRAGADIFSEAVLDHSLRHYGGFEFEDVGDPAGNIASQNDEKTAFSILVAKGINIQPAIQTLTIRHESVRRPLTRLIDGRPQFQLHPRCTHTRRALMGGYHWRRLKISGTERYSNTPDKNRWSHVADALGYGGTKYFGIALLQGERGLPDAPSNRFAASDASRSAITGY